MLRSIKSISVAVLVTLFFSCQNTAQVNEKQKKVQMSEPETVPMQNGKATAYFASGCFWCVEAIFEHVKGVDEVISGYSGGHTKNVTYEESNTGKTGHAEAVEVIYDPNIVSFEDLLDVYFATQDPTQVNGQGPDHGSQYRSIIFYQNEEQKQMIESKKDALAKKLNSKIAAEVYPFQRFWVAEDYHQNYERLHPNDRYIQNVSIPRLNLLRNKLPHLVKDMQ